MTKYWLHKDDYHNQIEELDRAAAKALLSIATERLAGNFPGERFYMTRFGKLEIRSVR